MECPKHEIRTGMGMWPVTFLRLAHEPLSQAAIDVGEQLSQEEALALGSTNMAKLLGFNVGNGDLVATEGGELVGMSGKVIAVISPHRRLIDLL